jgi:hypothetical protein
LSNVPYFAYWLFRDIPKYDLKLTTSESEAVFNAMVYRVPMVYISSLMGAYPNFISVTSRAGIVFPNAVMRSFRKEMSRLTVIDVGEDSKGSRVVVKLGLKVK